MCLTVTTPLRKAEEALYTLKIGRPSVTGFRTPFQGFEYEFKKLYTEPRFDTNLPKGGFSSRGFHSQRVSRLNRNSHNWFRYKHFDESASPQMLVLCKIPKGSLYYYGDWNDIVSNKIIIVEPVLANRHCAKLDGREFKLDFIDMGNMSWLKEIKFVCESYGIKLL